MEYFLMVRKMGVCESEPIKADPVTIISVSPDYFHDATQITEPVVTVACTLGKYTFSTQITIPCQRIPRVPEKPCSHVFVKPMINCSQEILYYDGMLRIYSNVKRSRMFVKDDINEMYPAQSQRQMPQNGRMVDIHGHYHKVGEKYGFHEVIIISTREYPGFLIDDPVAIHRPHCLILVLDCPQSIFLTFPL
jgi:hypothetical protein